MADYKNLTPEEVRATLESVDYGTLTAENIWDMRQSLETEKNNAAENEKNLPSYNILSDLAQEKLDALSPEDLDSMSPYELDSVKNLIAAYSNSNMGRFDGKRGVLMEKISQLQTVQNTPAAEPTAEPVSEPEPTPAPEPERAAEESKTSAEPTSAPVTDAAPQESVTDLADINDEKSPINKYNALEVMKKLNDLQPSELATLRRSLNAVANDQTIAAGAKLDEHILSQAQKYAQGKDSVVGIEESYAFGELLDTVKQYPNSDKVKDNAATLDAAINKVKQEISVFEESFGLDAEHLQAPEIVEQNIAALDGMPSDGQIFALELRPEKLQAPTELQDVAAVLESAEASKTVPELSVLAGALQCKELSEDQKRKLTEYAAARIKSTSSLEHKDFKNFEFLLDTVKKSPSALKDSVVKNKENLLSEAREAYKLQAPIKDKEFQDIYNVLNSLQIKGELQAFGRKNVDQNTKNSDIDLFREQVRRETEMYLANTSRHGITPEAFKQEYADRLRNNLVQLVYADKVSKGQISEKDFGKMFESMADAAKDKKPIKINQEAMVGWQAAKTARLESAVKVEGKKAGYEASASGLKARIKGLDNKLSQKYGALYSTLKTAAKSAGWGTAYSIAGATMGPAGVAMVATASFANTSYKYFKDYKKARNDAMIKGEKPDNLWQYMKKNKLKTAGVLMGAATVAIGVGGLGANAAVHAARAGSGLALAAAGAVNQGANAYKNTKGSKGQKIWAATKAVAVSGAAFAAAVWVGKEINGIATEAYAADTPSEPLPPVNDAQNDVAVADSLNVSQQPQMEVENPQVVAEQPQVVAEPAQEDISLQGQGSLSANAPEQVQETVDWQQKTMDELSQGLDRPQDGPEIPLRPQEEVAEAPASAAQESTANDVVAPEQVQESAANGVETVPAPEAIDVNNLTDSQAHDLKMLFLRDPREANSLLGQEGNDWMNSRELQEAWDNGNISPEQKAELVRFAGQRFDDHGNFVGDNAAQMEAEAKAYSAAHSAEPAKEAVTAAPVRDMEPLARVDSTLTAKAEPLQQSGIIKPAEQEVDHGIDKLKMKTNNDGTTTVKAVMHVGDEKIRVKFTSEGELVQQLRGIGGTQHSEVKPTNVVTNMNIKTTDNGRS